MPYINMPPTLSVFFDDFDLRLRKVENSKRFTAPSVNFATSTPTKPVAGDMFFDSNADELKYWDGSKWVIIADNNVGTPVIPFTSTWAGTGLTFTGTPAVGVYQKVGKQIHFQIKVTLTTVTNFGTGTYTLTLPTGLPAGYDYVTQGGLHSGSNHYALMGDLAIGSTTVQLYYPTSNGAFALMDHNSPKSLTTSDYFYIHGNYLTA